MLFIYLFFILLGECRTLWGEHEQAAQWFGNGAEVKIDVANIIRQANRE